ncbi:hypothetical protein EIN_178690 [Entamoeba invadens IP1]|uniref:hypothetical protein n=1 Tax=Entamoeba invadens IP1 TaxID=370355 RepID=UPI0002C3ECED|nr:hypothetical protein EIN_178690 [Entamoeba invadens IP1]ELP93912.1 hypothetical protein EIN_178690 [Entamoeba invadens IP1]|eukprot:XP_004260683.1 hypothetical protein EIN_178690 [Entamoeba invadens IP1]
MDICFSVEERVEILEKDLENLQNEFYEYKKSVETQEKERNKQRLLRKLSKKQHILRRLTFAPEVDELLFDGYEIQSLNFVTELGTQYNGVIQGDLKSKFVYLVHSEHPIIKRIWKQFISDKNGIITQVGDVFYFEAKMTGKAAVACVGMCQVPTQNVHLGTEEHSIGYHSSSGCVLSQKNGTQHNTTNYHEGDVIGCCYNFNADELFFTKNGTKLLSYNYNAKKDFFPSISIESFEKLEINWGQHPFVFDIASFVEDQKVQHTYTVKVNFVNDCSLNFDFTATFSVNLPPFCTENLLRKFVVKGLNKWIQTGKCSFPKYHFSVWKIDQFSRDPFVEPFSLQHIAKVDAIKSDTGDITYVVHIRYSYFPGMTKKRSGPSMFEPPKSLVSHI